ncbi:uncharacterized protein LOC111744295 [Pteropus vampyrus]|uniref:Uncharacterized protein LOC111744295 n=1 Tax=Pteropus vampyrus TaxID=132908 RepID=A0A6P6CTE6_PTEVA|nr:uncharacterized protein LOC111744295 [Pteropus vampyrus]
MEEDSDRRSMERKGPRKVCGMTANFPSGRSGPHASPRGRSARPAIGELTRGTERWRLRQADSTRLVTEASLPTAAFTPSFPEGRAFQDVHGPRGNRLQHTPCCPGFWSEHPFSKQLPDRMSFLDIHIVWFSRQPGTSSRKLMRRDASPAAHHVPGAGSCQRILTTTLDHQIRPGKLPEHMHGSRCQRLHGGPDERAPRSSRSSCPSGEADERLANKRAAS